MLLKRETDIYVASELAALLADEIGLDRYAQGDIETAVLEICSNALRHAHGGWMAIRRRRGEFEVSVTDRGPGFHAPRQGETGLGIGLEGARRLMGSLKVESVPGGSRVTAVRPFPPARPVGSEQSLWSVMAVSRSRAGEAVCGDEMRAFYSDGGLRVGVADGLGSGPAAAEAAQRVLGGLNGPGRGTPAEALAAAGRESSGTRGAAAVVVDLDGTGRGRHAALGDVSCVQPETGELVSRPGIVGHGTPQPVDSPLEIPPGGFLLIWSDGIRRPDLGPWKVSRPSTPGLDHLEAVVMENGDPRQDGVMTVVRRSR